jgi:hypothetical protein
MDLQKIIPMLLFGLREFNPKQGASLEVTHHLGWFYVFSYMWMWTMIVVSVDMVTHNKLILPLWFDYMID